MMNQALIHYRLQRFAELSPRLQEVARHFAENESRKEVAAKLFVEEHTVRCHLNAIYRQLGIGNVNGAHHAGRELAYLLGWADGYAASQEEKWAAA